MGNQEPANSANQLPQGKPRSGWSLHHALLHRRLKARQLLPAQAHVLVAVSGGQDSLCLLRLLLDLQPKWHWHLAVAHCDHGWSGDVGNADFVRRLVAEWHLPLLVETATDLPETEAAARNWRYQTLATLAQQHHFTHVVTGHTASDRAETLLYNLLRGSGTDGLQALTWQRELVPGVQLVRPLLAMTRQATAEFCRAHQIPIWDDPANRDRRFARSRIRQDLLPYLQAHFNPQVDTTLAQTAELLQADVAYLEASATELLDQVWQPGTVAVNRAILKQAPLALQRRVLRQFLQQTLPTAAYFEHVEKLVGLLTAPQGARTDPFPGGAIALVDGEWLRLES